MMKWKGMDKNALVVFEKMHAALLSLIFQLNNIISLKPKKTNPVLFYFVLD